ncbi:MAG: cupin domain-containing protein [Acidobacteria bacterium]|nr:cupin domain-containing protein [Acidobacteriota bacterium]
MNAAPTEHFSELYAAYAAGCLDPAFALMVETQSVLRPDVRRSIAVSDMIAGAVLETATPAVLSDGALARTLDAIEALETDAPLAVAAGRAAGKGLGEMLALPEPLRGAALDAVGSAGWKSLGRGITRLKMGVSRGMETELYRIEPGANIPRHTHAGREYTLVVAGGFTDERGSFGPGDAVLNQAGDYHTPVGDEGEVCFALVIRDGGLHFTGVFGLLQRLLGQR